MRLYFEWMAVGLEAMAMRLDLADCERAEVRFLELEMWATVTRLN